MTFDKSTLTSLAILTTEPVKLLDAIAAHPNCQPELAKLLDSVAQKYEELEDCLVEEQETQNMLKAELYEMEADKDYWEDKAGELEDEKFDLECKVEKLEAELDSLR